MSEFQVIYLTGPPASGKSSLCRLLQSRVQPLKVYHYSQLLAEHLNRRHSAIVSEDNLRESSAQLISLLDVQAVDELLISEVTEVRKTSHCIIDSHAVTKEKYGFRVTPFTFDKVRALRPTAVCMLHAESAEIIRRISSDSGGRPMISPAQADFHSYLQAQVGLAYSLELGLPFYVLDSTESSEAAADKLCNLFER